MAWSYWLEDPAEPLPRPAWQGRADVIIIGGGVTGCSCALTLAEAGVRVRLCEARELASGASGRNGGFALRGGAMAYDVARERLGANRAAAFWRLTVLPLAMKAARAISCWLKPRVGGEVTVDLNGLPAFQQDVAEQWARIEAAGFLTVEEKRRMAGVG